MTTTKDAARVMGRKGGKSTSPAKVQAARENVRKARAHKKGAGGKVQAGDQ